MESLVALVCSGLLAAATLPLLAGSAGWGQRQTAALQARAVARAALRSVAADLRVAGEGLEGDRWVAEAGIRIPVIGSVGADGLRLVLSQGPAREIEEPTSGGGYWLTKLGGLRTGQHVVALGLRSKPAGIAAPVGRIGQLLRGVGGGWIRVVWAAQEEQAVGRWGSPRALLPIVLREYGVRRRNGSLTLQRPDWGGNWQPVVDSLSAFRLRFILDRDDGGMPEEPTTSALATGDEEKLLGVAIEAEAEGPQGTVATMSAWAWLRGRDSLDGLW